MSYSPNSQLDIHQNYLDSRSLSNQVQMSEKTKQNKSYAVKKEPNYNRHRKFVIRLVYKLDKVIAEERGRTQVKHDQERKKKAADAYYILNKIKASYNPVKKVNKRSKPNKVSGKASNTNMYQLYCNKIFRTNLLWPFLDRIFQQSLKTCQPQSGDTLEQEEILACKEYWTYYVDFRSEDHQNSKPVSSCKRQQLQENMEQRIQTNQTENQNSQNIFQSLWNNMISAQIINTAILCQVNMAGLSFNYLNKNLLEGEKMEQNQQNQINLQIEQAQQTSPVKKLPVYIIQ